MAKMLQKESTLFERDEQGELIPQTVSLEVDKLNSLYDELKEVTIKIKPMTRGEIKKLFGSIDGTKETDRDVDEEIILKYCVEPSYTKEEAKYLKAEYTAPIVATILKHSGLDTGGKDKQQALKEAEDDFAKN